MPDATIKKERLSRGVAREHTYDDAQEALDNHGCGIAQANKISLSKLIYNEISNQVTTISRTS